MTSLNKLLCAILILTIQLVFLSSPAHSQTPDPKQKATGSISGRVTVGGKGAAGIAVAAISLDNRRTAAARTTTDNEGNYRLSGLPAAQYQVAPLTPDMTTGDSDADANYGFVYPGFGASKNIVLATGEEVENIDVKLVRGAVITGRVTDADNKPVVEERITLQAVDQNGNPSRIPTRLPSNSQMYQTDDRGVYRIYGLAAGHYKVSVGNDPNASVFLNSRGGYFLRTFSPNTTDAAKASIVDVAEGSEASNVDIQVGSRADTYTVTGHMVDSESGLPVSGVRVGYLLKRQNEQRYLSFMIMGPTGARGEFRTDGLSPGKYGAYAFSGSENGDLYSDPVYFEVIDKDVSGIEIKTVRGLSIGGFVVGDSQMPKDLLAQLQGLRINANIDSGPPAPPVGSGSSISADGSFLITGLRPGRVSIFLSALSGKRPSIVRIDHNGVGITQGFELQPGQSVSGLRVVIAYGSGTIRGSVRYEGGTPSPQARTFISYALEGTRGDFGTQLDARGHFIITGLSPGNYTLTLQTSALGQRPLPPQKQTVTVTNDNESQVNFVIDLTPKEGGP